MEYYQYTGVNIPSLTNEQLDVVNMWNIYAVDPNVDMGGCHGNKYIGSVECSLRDAIATAEKQPNWQGWGPSNTGYITREPRVVMLEVIKADGADIGICYEDAVSWMFNTTDWLEKVPSSDILLATAKKSPFKFFGVSRDALKQIAENNDVNKLEDKSVTIYQEVCGVGFLFFFTTENENSKS